eukprot:TRINITY_DN4752_c0_g1_i1.p1 TRINITY_DN4752_c0_g1~~TRINITY_DN4752_c0_g1_i1.p1  ORF type:complete len:276 (+),score=61.43 TRINITY_DN4752_c0_g1_i1:75-902(+)
MAEVLSAGQCVQVVQPVLFFPPPLNRSIENVVEVKNTAAKPITYKMKTSAPSFYSVKKRTGFIAPGETEKITVTFRGSGQKDVPVATRQKDRFQLEVRYLASDGSEEAAFEAIGSTETKGNGNFAAAVRALNKSQREVTGDGGEPKRSLDLPEDAKEGDILIAMWKSKKSFQPEKDGFKQISCNFTDSLPQGVHVEAKQTDRPTEPSAGSGTMQSARAPSSHAPAASTIATPPKPAAVAAQGSQGVPLHVCIIVAIVSMILGYLLGGGAAGDSGL